VIVTLGDYSEDLDRQFMRSEEFNLCILQVGEHIKRLIRFLDEAKGDPDWGYLGGYCRSYLNGLKEKVGLRHPKTRKTSRTYHQGFMPRRWL
jgi:hypothetical protein